MNSIRTIVALAMMIGGLAVAGPGRAQSAAAPPPPAFDAELARMLGADQHGMRRYVLVILKTGPTPVPQGPERDEMFRGHFANMQRLSAEGKLALAGPLDGLDGWRGLFILATDDLDEAVRLVATDPVIVKGEMIAEYHKYYGSAALMQVRDTHGRIIAQPL
jgi:uncharacterized protein YciI